MATRFPKTRKTALALAWTALAFLGCGAVPSAVESWRSAAGPLDHGTVQPLRPDIQRGVCLAHSYGIVRDLGYGSDASMASKKELLDLGVDWISVTPFGYQDDLDSTAITLNTDGFLGIWGETDKRVEAEISQAKDLGMKVMLKPHLWLGSNAWRGHIEPGSEARWLAWFDSYRTFILHYARLAEANDVEILVIGLELASASPHRAQWLPIIEDIRAVYSGQITYAANWNETHLVGFWDKVDFIGIQFFGPLTDALHPTDEALTQAMNDHLDGYEALSREHNKPVIFTEFGYKSIVATAISPGTWPEHLPEEARQYDEINQAAAFRAFLGTAGQRGFVSGIYLWKWFTDLDTGEEGAYGYSPRGRLAAKVLADAFRR